MGNMQITEENLAALCDVILRLAEIAPQRNAQALLREASTHALRVQSRIDDEHAALETIKAEQKAKGESSEKNQLHA